MSRAPQHPAKEQLMTSQLVDELRADAARIGKAQGIPKERLSLWRAADEIERAELEYLAEADSLRDRTLQRTVEAQQLRAAVRALIKVRPSNWDDDEDPEQVAAWKLAQEALGPPCVNHADQPSVTNLDSEDLCQECANAWVRGEGQAAAEREAEEAADVG